jgi:hypothetical protein
VRLSVVLHVPHASTVIPADVRAGIVLDDAALARELLASTDHHTDTLIAGLESAFEVPGRDGAGDAWGACGCTSTAVAARRRP